MFSFPMSLKDDKDAFVGLQMQVIFCSRNAVLVVVVDADI